jgi:hypothetical protein
MYSLIVAGLFDLKEGEIPGFVSAIKMIPGAKFYIPNVQQDHTQCMLFNNIVIICLAIQNW